VRERRLIYVYVATLLGSGGLLLGAQPSTPSEWRNASPGRTLEFPRDHASHPEYRVEWWYYTGNLESDDGRRFGYQVTFFRVGIDPKPDSPSPWAVRDLFMAHLAVTDLDRGRHLVDERLNRAGVGWAGARDDRLEVWNEDWRLTVDGRDHVLEVESDDGRFGVQLRLAEDRAPVLHGRQGFSQKGSTNGNASHYYSLTRMPTSGMLRMDGNAMNVRGASWMDHEFGTSFLEPAQQGWDWFSLQLEDGTDVMVYQLRLLDGSVHPNSSGTVVATTGDTHVLAAGDYRLEAGRVWESGTSEAQYPVEWRVGIPSAGLDLEVRAAVDAQELHTAESTGVTYWEGAVVVSGTRNGEPIQGRGYLEMTGYAGQPMSEVLR